MIAPQALERRGPVAELDNPPGLTFLDAGQKAVDGRAMAEATHDPDGQMLLPLQFADFLRRRDRGSVHR